MGKPKQISKDIEQAKKPEGGFSTPERLYQNTSHKRLMKLIQAIPMPKQVTEEEVKKFLQSKLNMQLSTIDEDGYPNVHPVWFYYDQDSGKILTGTQKGTRKVANITNNSDRVYFSIDEEHFPYKGVKGRAKASISEDIQQNVPIIEKINLKYLGTQDHPLAKRLLENAKTGIEVIIALSPKYYSAWDFSKAQ